jgi:hypothetical protein
VHIGIIIVENVVFGQMESLLPSTREIVNYLSTRYGEASEYLLTIRRRLSVHLILSTVPLHSLPPMMDGFQQTGETPNLQLFELSARDGK